MRCKTLGRCLLLALVSASLLVIVTNCAPSSNQPTSTPTPALEIQSPAADESPVPEVNANAWPDDIRIAYCPRFEDSIPTKVTDQSAEQRKAYIISFEGVDQEAYDAYAKTLEDDENITIVTNFNTRGTTYSLHANKADDSAYEIRITYTMPTKKMQISVTYAK